MLCNCLNRCVIVFCVGWAWAGLTACGEADPTAPYGTEWNPQPCERDAQCHDANPCTDDHCAGGLCAFVFNQDPCSDGLQCTIEDRCEQGVCAGQAPLDCDDGRPCTLDACSEDHGCQHSLVDGPCECEAFPQEITSEESLGYYRGCSAITGDLVIRGTDLADLDELFELRIMDGSLVIADNPALENLEALLHLERVTGDLVLTGNSELSSLVGLGSLQLVGGRLHIDNQRLESVAALSQLELVGGELTFGSEGSRSNPRLERIHGLERLAYAEGVRLIGLEALESVELNALGEIDSLLVSDCPALGRLSLASLKTARFVSISATALEGLEGFDDLVSLDHGLIVHANRSLRRITGFANLAEVGELRISDNAELVDLSGLGNLTHVRRNLRFESNTVLQSLSGLDGLRQIDGSLYVEWNDSLTRLTGLGSLARVGADLWILHNPLLPGLECVGLIQQLDTAEGIGGSAYY